MFGVDLVGGEPDGALQVVGHHLLGLHHDRRRLHGHGDRPGGRTELSRAQPSSATRPRVSSALPDTGPCRPARHSSECSPGSASLSSAPPAQLRQSQSSPAKVCQLGSARRHDLQHVIVPASGRPRTQTPPARSSRGRTLRRRRHRPPPPERRDRTAHRTGRRPRTPVTPPPNLPEPSDQPARLQVGRVERRPGRSVSQPPGRVR